ncbi:hypothetical protein RBB78_04395 [Tunturiibacter empetritectus]|uniref:hypothetical protein n=1 Tax=Tunturiibacter empetritectus TaxID=3069691 RepID=UPI003D9B703A
MHVGGGDVDEAACGGAVALGGMKAVEGCVEDFVDDVVAAGDEGDRGKCQEQRNEEMRREERRIDAQRHDDAGQNEEILDGMIESGDGEMGAESL